MAAISKSRSSSRCSTECERIRIGLGIIAAAILEAEENVTTEVMANTQRIEFSPARGNRPDVSLLIKILHRHDYDSPVDAQERTCLEKLKARLRSLGAFDTTGGATEITGKNHWSMVSNEPEMHVSEKLGGSTCV